MNVLLLLRTGFMHKLMDRPFEKDIPKAMCIVHAVGV